MTFTEELRQALRNQHHLIKKRPERLLARALVYAGWWVLFGVAFAVVNGIQSQRIGTAIWWINDLPGHMVVSLCVTLCFALGYRTLERLAPQRWLDALSRWRDWRSATFYSTLSIVLTLTGLSIGFVVVGSIWGRQELLMRLVGKPSFWAEFLLISVIVTAVFSVRYRARWKEEALQARVTEAQLKLLQGQIEPHFLFNTLANVQSLIDFDPERAKLMLERFTDYLRASLAQLRGDSTTLAQEFAMLDAYLALMQLRMGERLQVVQQLPPELAGFALPPLLLQPLVENAIHHGLEPKVEGGTITVGAALHDGRIVLQVEDDGQGLDAPRRRAGNGVALANIRERLQARFGPSATLSLLPRDGGGTLARIDIPLSSLPTPP